MHEVFNLPPLSKVSQYTPSQIIILTTAEDYKSRESKHRELHRGVLSLNSHNNITFKSSGTIVNVRQNEIDWQPNRLRRRF